MKRYVFVLSFLVLAGCGGAKKEVPPTVTQKNATAAPVKEEAIVFEVTKTQPAAPAQTISEFVIYTDKNAPGNHYIPSGWIGDTADIKMNDASVTVHSGTTGIQFTYSAKKSQGQGWAGVYWQNPSNNWGKIKGGYDLTGVNKLTFWARGEKGGEVLQKVGVGGIGGDYPDTTSVEFGPIVLTSEWQQYTINLVGKDLSYINGGFFWVVNADQNQAGATFYIDDIKYASDAAMTVDTGKKQAMPFYVYAGAFSGKNHYTPSGYMGDIQDVTLDAKSLDYPRSSSTSLKVAYSAKKTNGQGWAGIYWQNPPNNWGTVDGGYDLSSATKLTFWARGAKGGEVINECKVGGLNGQFSDTDVAILGPITLTTEWQQYTIDLAGKDLSYIIGGFALSINIDMNPLGATFYLDEIKYE